LRVDEDVFLNRRFEATGSGELGAVRMLGAHFGALVLQPDFVMSLVGCLKTGAATS
jgi:hypothetical protein